jgi:hypothetical protein
LFATTRQFLDDLGLASLEQLPVLDGAGTGPAALLDQALAPASGGGQGTLALDEAAAAQAAVQAEPAPAEPAPAEPAPAEPAPAEPASAEPAPAEPHATDAVEPAAAANDQGDNADGDAIAVIDDNPTPDPLANEPAADAAPMEPQA